MCMVPNIVETRLEQALDLHLLDLSRPSILKI